MSDRVTNAEIEDVLSSIRRLVSVDHRRDIPAQKDKDLEDTRYSFLLTKNQKAEAAPAEPTEENEKLILSPSFRVRETQRELTHDTETVESCEKHESLGLAEWQISSEVPEGEKSREQEDVDETRAESSQDGSSVSLEILTETSYNESSEKLGKQSEKDELAGLLGRVGSDYPQAPLSEETRLNEAQDHFETRTSDGPTTDPDELEARIAEVEAAVAARDDQWEPDGSETDVDGPPPMLNLAWRKQSDAAEAPSEDPSRNDEGTLNAGDSVVRSSDQSIGPANDVEADVRHGKSSDNGPDWLGEDAILDEEALRDLVSEIVRQELQGSLGERITRNVRKLVRREIHRAMMEQDLD